MEWLYPNLCGTRWFSKQLAPGGPVSRCLMTVMGELLYTWYIRVHAIFCFLAVTFTCQLKSRELLKLGDLQDKPWPQARVLFPPPVHALVFYRANIGFRIPAAPRFSSSLPCHTMIRVANSLAEVRMRKLSARVNLAYTTSQVEQVLPTQHHVLEPKGERYIPYICGIVSRFCLS